MAAHTLPRQVMHSQSVVWNTNPLDLLVFVMANDVSILSSEI